MGGAIVCGPMGGRDGKAPKDGGSNARGVSATVSREGTRRGLFVQRKTGRPLQPQALMPDSHASNPEPAKGQMCTRCVGSS